LIVASIKCASIGVNSFVDATHASCSAEVERNQSNHVAHFARCRVSSAPARKLDIGKKPIACLSGLAAIEGSSNGHATGKLTSAQPRNTVLATYVFAVACKRIMRAFRLWTTDVSESQGFLFAWLSYQCPWQTPPSRNLNEPTGPQYGFDDTPRRWAT
jgi:hypothetical protein